MIVWNNGSKSNGNHGYHRGQNNNLSINKDRNSNDSRVDVVVGTPGRIQDLLDRKDLVSDAKVTHETSTQTRASSSASSNRT